MPTTPPFSSGKGASGETTVVGVVEEGVERGCMILRAGDQVYQLVGSADPQIKPGARLSVRGRLNPGLVTTCQQGTPLQVIAVQPA
jgi:NADH:ubiquinone oxidoreductase subunit F (NADH-binding)